MPKVILINPAISTFGYSFFTPRWLFVIAQATPTELVGDPVILDESIERFNPDLINPGDIVGIGISSGNCTAGYRLLREVKLKGGTVIMGGIHPTIFPREPLEMGADAVVTGNGDVVWDKVVRDALGHSLQKQYVGGRVPGDAMLKARWDLLDPRKYLFATIQTVAGCPESCSFCSVWVTDGRKPRQRLSEKIIEEANELHSLGFRHIAFADDNFNPATLGRIAREPSSQKRKELERLREERLRFFDEYDRSVPRDLLSMTQMTSEVVSDEEYLSAMYRKMRIRAALIGVESFSNEGLESANKRWNPDGEEMVETIRTIQAKGILVLSSIICGLESDTVQTLQNMREFARESGTLLAQFTYYSPYPGTKDYYEMIGDERNRDRPGFAPKHRIRIRKDKFWLSPQNPAGIIEHPNIDRDNLILENKRCWDTFYSFRESLQRTRDCPAQSWPLAGKITYIFACLAFKRVYAGNGISADGVNRKRAGLITRMLIKAGLSVYNYYFRRRTVGLNVSLTPSKDSALSTR
jgi:radical SAM superfamily enzyme YgiQ (UPF0313 family)